MSDPEVGSSGPTPRVDGPETAIQDADIPAELRERDQWLLWSRDSDPPKQPLNADGYGASWTDPGEWLSYGAACDLAADSDRFDGIGFVVAENDPYVGLDLDGCLRERGEPKPEDWLPDLAPLLDTYAEYSVSGTGIHVFTRHDDLPEWWTDSHFSDEEHEGVEAYTEKFFIMTGEKLDVAAAEVGEADVVPFLADAYEAIQGDPPQLPGAGDGPDTETHVGVYDVITRGSYPEGENTSHPFHPSSTGTNFRVDPGGETFRCWRHGVTGNGGHLLGIEQGVIECGEWVSGGLDDETWREIFDAGRAAGYDIPEPETGSRENDSDSAAADETASEGGGSAEWGTVREILRDDDLNDGRARRIAVDILNGSDSFAAMRDTEELYRYNPETGIYDPGAEQYVGRVLDDNLGDTYSTYQREEVVARLKDRNWVDRDEFGATVDDPRICVANGVLDLPTGNLAPHSPSERFIRRIPVEFDSDAECPEFDAFLEDVLGQPEDKQLVYEVLGLAIHPGYLKARTLLLYGDGRNGKSTLLDVFERFLGADNVANRTLQELEYDDFAAADLYGNVANICGDLPSDKLKDTGMLKRLTGGDSVTANAKYKQPYTFRNEAMLIFSANDPPAVEDDSTAFYRRLLLLNFPHEFTPPGQPGPDQRPKAELMAEIATDSELSGILNQAIEGIRRIRETGAFSQETTVEELRDQYKLVSDPVYAFASECLDDDSDGFVTTDELYACYVEWCNENDAPKKAKNIVPQLLQEHIRMDKGRGPRSEGRPTGYNGISFTSRGSELLGENDGTADPSQQTIG